MSPLCDSKRINRKPFEQGLSFIDGLQIHFVGKIGASTEAFHDLFGLSISDLASQLGSSAQLRMH